MSLELYNIPLFEACDQVWWVVGETDQRCEGRQPTAVKHPSHGMEEVRYIRNTVFLRHNIWLVVSNSVYFP